MGSSNNIPQRLYLSAPGVVNAAGTSLEALWKSAICADNSSIKTIQLDGLEKPVSVSRVEQNLAFSPQKARFNTHCTRLENAALMQIQSTIEKAKARYTSARVAVCVGSCDNMSETSLWGHADFFAKGAFPKEYSLTLQSADYVATFVKEEFGVEGMALAFAAACTSSASAIIKAASLIKSGLCDACIAGGVDLASDTVLLGFSALEAVSPVPTNPFSKNRCGITLGDGAAFFVLSKDPLDEECAVLLKGWGESSDAYHLTAPRESGEGAVCAMTKALKAASLSPTDIGYLSLHGTGTLLNDKMEGLAVSRVFDTGIVCSATKSITGHTLGASSALSLALSYKALLENQGKEEAFVLPAQAWDEQKDSDIPSELQFVDAAHNGISLRTLPVAQKGLNNCMVNSFGFGGANASLIVGLEEQ